VRTDKGKKLGRVDIDTLEALKTGHRPKIWLI
jgi:hypothetical protein